MLAPEHIFLQLFCYQKAPTMKYKKQQPNKGDRSIQMEVKSEPPNGSSSHQPDRLRGRAQTETIFVPEPVDPSPSVQPGSGSSHGTTPAPEKKLTCFALWLAVLEKTASGLGTLAFIWATVVLLGGFASDLTKTDFYVVTTILLIEGTRIFGRRNELEWQHHAASILASARRYSFRPLKSSTCFLFRDIKAAFRPFSVVQTDDRRQRSASGQAWQDSPEVPLVPYGDSLLLLETISIILYWLQPMSATACMVLSVMRLVKNDYGDNRNNNKKPALIIFYGLALAEALLFLLERAYWDLKVSCGKLLEDVCKECELDSTGEVAIKRFFYDAYSKCVNGSIFDGLEMDLVTFSEELLNSNFRREQLIGAQILRQFVKSKDFAPETLRKIGTSTQVMERLIEMLNWKNPTEKEIRQCAAEIVSKLAGKNQNALRIAGIPNQNALRIAGIPGSMESISSLLYTWPVAADQADYQFPVFNELGLLILKKLADDHDNCGKIGNARGLLSKIIDFSSAPMTQIKALKRSLQLVKKLVSTTGSTGKMLRQRISEIVFTVSHMRNILQYGESHMVLQKLAIEALTGLAMDESAKETIGRTGGVIKLLLSILFRPRLTGDENSVCDAAGEALSMLALKNKNNCHRISKEKEALKRLIGALSDPVLQLHASRILRNLCAYSGIEHSLRGVTAAIPTVLKAVMLEKGRLLEVSIGLTMQICKFMDPQEFAKALEQADIKEKEAIVERLVQILKEYDHPSIQVPRIRRFVIEQATWLVRSNRDYIQLFKNLEIEKLLEGVADTTTELECFHVFSGSVGLKKHSRALSSLVEELDLMLGSCS